MATGTLKYWNGESGWIKQSGVENLPTIYANDVFVVRYDVVAGSMIEGCAVDYTIDATIDCPMIARSVTAS